MARRGKKIAAVREKLEKRNYSVEEAVGFLVENSYARFDETLEIAMRLGVNPKYADQMVRGTVMLPNGTGVEKRVVAFAAGDAAEAAKEAGAIEVGAEDLAKRIEEGWLDFDAAVATPEMMRIVGKLGKVLGPRGLMPNPKTGTVTNDISKAVGEIKKGKVEFRVDKAGIVHAPLGKLSFGPDKLVANTKAFALAVIKAKPPAAKGRYLRGVALSSTMGPGLDIDTSSLEEQ
jgi:large subunit ribosomal protein L1